MKLRVLTAWYWEVLCLLVYLALAGKQLFVRPIIGLADNGDFPKVLGPRNVCDPDRERDAFAYVYPSYIIDFECRWNNHIVSSESLVVRLNKLIARWDYRRSFRITGAGKAHLAVMAAALIILLWALHRASPRLRFGLPPLVILIFSDVAYVAYLNSFYMDAAAMVFLLLTVALAAAWVLRPHAWIAPAFGVAGVLMALAKTQHIIIAIFLAGVAAWFACRAFRHQSHARQGWLWTLSAAAVSLAAVVAIRVAPPDIRADPFYNLVFFSLLPESPHPLATLAELGLPESYVAYSGTYAYSQGSPMPDPKWRNEFTRRFTFRRLAAYYFHHPAILLRMVRRGLTDDVSGIRANLGNYQRADGFPPFARTHRFEWWSNLRSWLLRTFPAHIVIFYCLMGVVSLLCLFRPAFATQWPLYPLVLALVASGTAAFLLSVLLDVVETPRHLFLFHVITEILILCSAAAVLAYEVPRTVAHRLQKTPCDDSN